MARPKKIDARNIVYKVRLNDEENRMLTDASEWTSQAKSEVFRKALQDYYQVALKEKQAFDRDAEASGWSLDHISLKRVIKCPYSGCGDEFSIDFNDYSEEQESEGDMGTRCEHMFDTDEIVCPSCKRKIHVKGVISEYPVGGYEYEDIQIEKEV